ncbi:MAG TPA: M2 family metallopeptidase, partial [Candidatus Acidoferrales bacterium]
MSLVRRLSLPALMVFLLLPASLPAESEAQQPPTVAEARQFVERAEARLLELWIKAERAAWVQSNFITVDTELLAADARREVIAVTTDLALAARRFDGLPLPGDVAHKMKLLKLSLTLPAPNTPAAQKELTEIAASLESDYGKGKYCPPSDPQNCLDINGLSRILAESRDPKKLLEAWTGWHAISRDMRPR